MCGPWKNLFFVPRHQKGGRPLVSLYQGIRYIQRYQPSEFPPWAKRFRTRAHRHRVRRATVSRTVFFCRFSSRPLLLRLHFLSLRARSSDFLSYALCTRVGDRTRVVFVRWRRSPCDFCYVCARRLQPKATENDAPPYRVDVVWFGFDIAAIRLPRIKFCSRVRRSEQLITQTPLRGGHYYFYYICVIPSRTLVPTYSIIIYALRILSLSVPLNIKIARFTCQNSKVQ